MESKYINPFTDFGFKKIFGEEASKPMLIDFLNALLPLETPIKDLSFKNPEQLGQIEGNRKAIYDIYCENKLGERFIVELQKAKQDYFKERTIFYSSFPIQQQAKTGPWNFNLKPVFCIGILDFIFTDYGSDSERNKVIHLIKLKDQDNEIFYEKLTYIYLEMPNFRKKSTELESRLDKWLYFLKHLEDFQKIPQIFKGEVIFEAAFEKAALARFNKSEWDSYEHSLKVFRDLKNVIDSAEGEGERKGRLKGVQEGRLEGEMKGWIEGEEEGAARGRIEMRFKLAKTFKSKGIPIDTISTTIGIAPEELRDL